MNVYFVKSEMLMSHGSRYSDPPEPPEPYCIAELVLARSRSQAEYLAWQHDPNHRSRDVRDKPHMSTMTLMRDMGEGAPGIVSEDPAWDFAWALTFPHLKEE